MFQVKTIRPTLSTMGWGCYHITFDDAQRPAGKKAKGGMIVLPGSFFEGHVRDTVARVFGAHASTLEGHWTVGLFFTGRYGRSVGTMPEYSSRSPCVSVDCDAVNLRELAWLVTDSLKAKAALVVPWGSSTFHIVSKEPS